MQIDVSFPFVAAVNTKLLTTEIAAQMHVPRQWRDTFVVAVAWSLLLLPSSAVVDARLSTQEAASVAAENAKDKGGTLEDAYQAIDFQDAREEEGEWERSSAEHEGDLATCARARNEGLCS